MTKRVEITYNTAFVKDRRVVLPFDQEGDICTFKMSREVLNDLISTMNAQNAWLFSADRTMEIKE